MRDNTHRKTMHTHREIAIILWGFFNSQKKRHRHRKMAIIMLVFGLHRLKLGTHRKNKLQEWIWLWRPIFVVGACLLVLARYRIEKRVKKNKRKQKHPKTTSSRGRHPNPIPNAPPEAELRRDCSHSRSTVAPGSKSAARRTRPPPSAHSPLAARL